MPEFKKDKSGFRMKGFSPFNMGNAYKTPMKKPLVGNQDRLPEELKEKILDSPMTMYDKSAMKKYGESPMKKYGKSPMKQDNKTDERVFDVNQEKYDKWNRLKNRGKGPDVRYLGAKENKSHLDKYTKWKKDGGKFIADDGSPMKKKTDPPVKKELKLKIKAKKKVSMKNKGTGMLPVNTKEMEKKFKKITPPAKPSGGYFNPEYWSNFDEID